MILGNYNGVSVLALPKSPAAKQVALSMNSIVAMPTNPFSGTQLQTLAWPGGDYWTGEIALPRLTPAQLPVWAGFLAECRGKLNCFLVGDASYTGPHGNVHGVPVVNGAQTPGAFTLNTTGWTPNSFRLLLPGDYLQLGSVSTTTGATTAPRLHRVLEPVNSDANGNATISLWPSLRDAVANAQPVILNAPVGLFRMADNKQTVTVDETRMGATSLKIVEAR